MNVYGRIDITGNYYIDKEIYKLFRANLRDYLENKDCIIFPENYIYLIGETDKNNIKELVLRIFDKVNQQYVRPQNTTEKEESKIYNRIRSTIKKMFFQTYDVVGGKFKTFYTAKADGNLERTDTSVTYIKKYTTEDNEMMNFMRFEYERKYRNNMTFNDYVCGLYDREFGKSKKLFFNIVFKTQINVYDWPIDKVISIVVAPNKKWEQSAILTAKQLANANIFSTEDYIFYSESSTLYDLTYAKIVDVMRNAKYFDYYYKNLNINKYFISDAVAIKKGSAVVRTLKNKITELQSDPSIVNLKNLFEMMDRFFSEKELIPISFKQIVEKKGIIDSISANSYIKILNKPDSASLDKYRGVDLDNFDLLLLDILNRVKAGEKLENIFKQNLIIKPNTFNYTKGITNFYFEFDLDINGKKKTYMFEVSGSVKIRPKGTSSPTGEGTINTQSLNYIMNRVYTGGYSNELSKIVSNRLKTTPNNNSPIVKKYLNFIRKKELITPSESYDGKTKVIKSIFLGNDPNKAACIQHLKGYANKLNIQDVGEIKDDKVLKNLLGKICGKELGTLFDADVQVTGDLVKINLTDLKKKQLISSAWGMVSARGPIKFLDATFSNADKLADLMMYKIKLPALVKVGI